MATLANDDNLQSGQTYTFTFVLDNIFTTPSVPTILSDMDQMPDSILGSVSASFSSGVGLLTNYLNITFNYVGDGGDVVSDVAQLFIDAFNNGSGDHFEFSQASSGTAGITALTAVATVANNAGAAAGNAVGAVIGGAASGVASNLGFSGWTLVGIIGLGLAAYVLATTGIGRRALA
jgi:hypothetical protein